MSATTTKILQAALEVAGGTKPLSRHLGIDEGLLATYMADRRVLPDALLLRAVDLIVAGRRQRLDGLPPPKSVVPPDAG